MVRIASDRLSAAIDSFGAELTHLHDADGRELMTDADPAFWPRHAPLLFPVVGVVTGGTVRIDGVEHPMPKHGFARDMAFEVARHDRTRAVFQLVDSQVTREHYPFAFLLEVAFAIADNRLSIEARIANRSDRPMPAQFGFHPAFAWPLPFGEARANHRITFGSDEPGALAIVGADGTIAPGDRPSPLDGRELLLRDPLFDDDALVWDPVRSSHLLYGAAQGPVLRIDFPDTPRLGIWTKPRRADGSGPRFVCIEPWHGIADPHGYDGEMADKPGVFVLAPGGEKLCRMDVTLVA